jgi:hypothetical protein
VSLTPQLVILASIAYGVAYLALGGVVLPGGPTFAVALIWMAAVVGADAAAWVSRIQTRRREGNGTSLWRGALRSGDRALRSPAVGQRAPALSRRHGRAGFECPQGWV